MKKIININLSGRVIPIEDSAYEKLQSYIDSLRRYFAYEEGRDEIINDIEGRIAELLHDNIRKGAAAVTEEDVDAVMASMGRPEDFEAEAAEAGESAQQPGTSQAAHGKKTKGRLYRDTSDKVLGGVCSGIAAYLNVDPAIVRILFAIITLGGFGVGFLVYILLWMILPPRDIEGYTGKRLFRNPDDKVIGGVAGGLAAYFGKSPSTIRLIFAAPILLSILLSLLDGFRWGQHGFDIFPNLVFGSLTSTFVLAYIILWIVLPEANSPYEKMEMRGEKVDLHSIRQNVKEGADSFRDKMKSWGDEVKDSAQNLGQKAKEFTDTRGKAFASEIGETARRGGNSIGHAIGVLFKAFFLFIAGTIAIAVFALLLALLFGGMAWWPINDFLWTSSWQQLFAWGTLIFFIGVPLIGFITWVVRRILRVKSRNSYLPWTFGFLWTLGWVAAIGLTTSVIRDFSMDGNTDELVQITQPASGKMIVAVSEPELFYTGRFRWIDGNEEDGWDLANDTLRLSTVRFNIRASVDSNYHVVMRRHSYGRTEKDAVERASAIGYSVIWRDSVLDLANGYSIYKDSKFRGQQVEMEIMVPIGKQIRFDESVNDKLNPSHILVKRRYRNNGGLQIEINDDYWQQFRSGVDYVMGIDGRLQDLSGKPVIRESYRYPGASETPNSLEEQRRKVEEEQKRLKEMEEKESNKQKQSSTALPESMDAEEDGSVSGSPSSIISMVSWL